MVPSAFVHLWGYKSSKNTWKLTSFNLPSCCYQEKTKTQVDEEIELRSKARFFFQHREPVCSLQPPSQSWISLDFGYLISSLITNVPGAEVIWVLIRLYDPGYSLLHKNCKVLPEGIWPRSQTFLDCYQSTPMGQAMSQALSCSSLLILKTALWD